MKNSKAKLHKNVFHKNVEMAATRDGFGLGLVEAGKKNKHVVSLCADLSESTRSHWFKKQFPERFFQMGVAEQNMITVAAGMAVTGKVPFVASYATFMPGRAWEQVRTTVSYNDANVKIAGCHAGISVGPDGATHQAIEDIATMRVMANMTVIVPCDAVEAQKATEAAAKIMGPVYIRLGRAKTPIFTTPQTPFTPGKTEVFWNNDKPDVVIIATGSLVHTALLAAKELEKEKIKPVVLNVHTIKPLDEKTILEHVKKAKAVVTVEEHQVLGGLGGAISELLAKKSPTPIEFIGMQDTFGESGEQNELIKKYGMDEKAILRAVKKILKRKK